MSNVIKYLILLAMALKTAQMLDINCLQLPTQHVRYMQTCCRFSRFKFQIYDSQCAHVATKSGIFGLNRYFNPCALECVFNASSLLQNKYDLNLPLVQEVLNNVLDDRRFVETYYNSFRTCVPLIKSKIEKSIARGRTAILDGRRCSNLPIMYGICAHAQTYLNCPTDAWSNTRPCNETKKFLTDCMEKV